MSTMEYILDAEGKVVGRVATEAATLLCGKNSPDYERNTVQDVKVKIINTSKIKVHNDKLNTRYHKHYTGYTGGMRYETLAVTATKKGYSEIMRLAVFSMLPDNKLKPIMMKNLIISE